MAGTGFALLLLLARLGNTIPLAPINGGLGLHGQSTGCYLDYIFRYHLDMPTDEAHSGLATYTDSSVKWILIICTDYFHTKDHIHGNIK